jgi:UDP-N-acetylmuramoylalanine--D-glutamate ligase
MIDLKPLKPQLNNKPIAIVGLGKSGVAAYEACRAAGIEAVLWDDNAAARKDLPTEDLTQADFSRFALLCLAPGIPLTHPAPHPTVVQARKAGCEVVCDIELFHRAHPGIKTIGITGTNGKSTTTALIGHILKVAGIESAVGGNIGEAALSLPELSAKGVYVFELSSYQLDLCPTFAPDIAVLINLAPDHLDRHGDMAGYIAAKKKIFRGKGVGIVGLDDDWSREVYGEVANSARKNIPVSCLSPLAEGVSVTPDGILKDNGRTITDLKPFKTLQGQHNWQNAAMAYAACSAYFDIAKYPHPNLLPEGEGTKKRSTPPLPLGEGRGEGTSAIIEGLKTFPGLAHRQNIVATLAGITYINDSKATNDQAAAMALRTYDPIYWIAGGKAKDGGYGDCEKYIRHVRHAFLIGDAQEKMAAWLKTQNTPFTLSSTLDKAVAAAHALAQQEKCENAVVLLSPACASFDQFKNFEHRGEVFADLVKKIIKGAAA